MGKVRGKREEVRGKRGEGRGEREEVSGEREKVGGKACLRSFHDLPMAALVRANAADEVGFLQRGDVKNDRASCHPKFCDDRMLGN